mmetsp:Transcript_20120/g.55415  ORF Transcript_20120/g.55415 Transcript_20120/m.55415 type:complete len:380 (+) Transcript_20120:793-1932(+)
MRAEGLNVCQLGGLQLQHGLALLSISRKELCKGGNLAGPAKLQGLLCEVRDLQQLRALHIQRLHQAAAEVQHGLRRGEPLAHAGNLDHRLGDLHGVPQQRVAVAPELRCHEVVAPLHVGPDKELVLHDDGQGEGAPLVLDDLARELLDVLVVRRPHEHASALGAGGEELGARLQARGLVHVVAEKLQGLDHDAICGKVLCPLVVADEGHGDNKDEQEEECTEDRKVVLLLEKEARQPDANLRGLRAVGIAILLPVALGNLVRQGLVRLGDLDEARGGQRVVGVLVGVVDQGELPVGPLDFLVRRLWVHFEDFEGVKLLDLLLLAELHHGADDAHPDRHQDCGLDNPANSCAPGTPSGCLPGIIHFVDHVGGVAVAQYAS